MAFLSSMNISGSALTASRLRMDVIAENIANADTTRTEGGGPYRRKTVTYQSVDQSSFSRILSSRLQRRQQTAGVIVTSIEEDQSEFTSVYDPEHPDADENGYVLMPNVDSVKETVDMMSATRAYEANLTVFEAVKTMALKALEMGR